MDFQTKVIESAEEQRQLAEDIQEVVENYSEVMKSEDVKKTTVIIDNLLDYDEEGQSDTFNNNVRIEIEKVFAFSVPHKPPILT